MLSPTHHAVMATLLCYAFMATLSLAQPVETRIDGTPGQWQLLRAGKPYFIKGAGGNASPDLLKKLGGNSIRTWGADDIGAQLDAAHKLGLTVTVGIWLDHAGDKFNYNNADQVAGLMEKARTAILKHKDHPAVLMWGIGNEMEGPAGDNAAIWATVNSIAAMAKRLDPKHPTMTVIAELGANGTKVKNLHRFCPDIDVVGVNSYGGAPSVPERYQAAGGTKPYVMTEFGPIGFWEGGHTSYKAPIEPTSSQKAAMYDNAYAKGITAAKGTCLGGYAFLWGHKQETTHTWFGMLLADDSMTNAVSVISRHWTGRAVSVPPPEIQPIRLEGGDERKPGDTVKASVVVESKRPQLPRLQWQLFAESTIRGQGGSYEPPVEEFAGAIASQSGDDATVTLPQQPGIYRLYVTARDDSGNAATANVPIRVDGPSASANTPADTPAGTPKAGGLKQPVVLYGDDAAASGYVPSGWMGNAAAIKVDPASRSNPHSGATAMACQYAAPDQFGGVVWQSPANNWGEQAGGRDLTGAFRLRFWARGEQGGETVEFKFGVLQEQQKFKDSATGGITVTLTKEWKEYAIDLSGKDLSRVMTGFCWVTPGRPTATAFHLDDIAFE